MTSESEAIKDELIEMAWGIIANAHQGMWENANDEWQEAARGWRDRYHAQLAIGRIFTLTAETEQ